MSSFLYEQNNKLVPCPKAAEESWKRTNPEIFFLPDQEVLNFQGQNALENKNKLNPWKVNFRDCKDIDSILLQIESLVGKNGIESLKNEKHRVVLMDISHGNVNVYMADNLKSHLEFMSTPMEIEPVVKNSAIALALANRLKSSSPHKIAVTLSSHNKETPLFIIFNHLNNEFTQSFCSFHLLLKKNSKADIFMVDGGTAFSHFRHHLELEENAQLNELWMNCPQKNKSLYSERMVQLAENAKFTDSQIFSPKGNMRITSHIQFDGIHSRAECGGVVLANEGKFDYEPIQEHVAPQSSSNLFLKIILNKNAKAAFEGLIIARKSAQKCVAKQENKNILLSKQARVDSEPRLEILPHDIVCKHGSATGEIDLKQMYYLESRGFSSEQARQLILKSFAQSAFPFLEEENSFLPVVESILNNVVF